ncbi:MAG: hypothetical protein J6F33_04200, partial [Acidaminococcaceae bacterium]|nr:hypothetical protein [Acidaminococcaceae bacterium]
MRYLDLSTRTVYTRDDVESLGLDEKKLMPVYWYAVMVDRAVLDWGYGSWMPEEAVSMLLNEECRDAYIAVIDVDSEGEAICVREIKKEDL